MDAFSEYFKGASSTKIGKYEIVHDMIELASNVASEWTFTYVEAHGASPMRGGEMRRNSSTNISVNNNTPGAPNSNKRDVSDSTDGVTSPTSSGRESDSSNEVKEFTIDNEFYKKLYTYTTCPTIIKHRPTAESWSQRMSASINSVKIKEMLNAASSESSTTVVPVASCAIDSSESTSTTIPTLTTTFSTNTTDVMEEERNSFDLSMELVYDETSELVREYYGKLHKVVKQHVRDHLALQLHQ
jgi:hypothetical protein